MQTRRRYFVWTTLWCSKSAIIFMGLYSAAVVSLYVNHAATWALIPWEPVSLVGTLVAFGLGFKNNSSYARLWEARTIWGAIVNTSRAWTVSVLKLVNDRSADGPVDPAELAAIRKRLVYRHLAWLGALRFALRGDRQWEHVFWPADRRMRLSSPERTAGLDALVKPFLSDDERAFVTKRANPATHLLDAQAGELAELRRRGLLDDFRHMELTGLVRALFDEQGKCERIKNFAFPRQYASFNYYALWTFTLLLPFGLLDALVESGLPAWSTIPFATVLTWLFMVTEMIGDYSENPFEGLWNDVPITALSRTIEIDLRELLGETDLPAPIAPVHDILL